MKEIDEVVAEFLLESQESLDRLDQDLLELESHPEARERIASVFRTLHTLKGTSSCLGFTRLETLAHAGENLLSLARDGQLVIDREIANALLALVDAVRRLLAQIESTGAEGTDEFGELERQLRRLQGSLTPPARVPGAEAGADVAARKPIGQILVESGRVEEAEVERALARQKAGDRRPLGEILLDSGAVSQASIQEALHIQKELRPVAETTLRVDVAQLDALMNLAGELVLARNHVLQLTLGAQDGALGATRQRLELLTTELQVRVMKTRLQPISALWNKLPRTVRDLSSALGKQIRLELEGAETELDKTLLEALKDPLTHIVRNACDHGIETPEVRAQRGKPPEGVLRLRAGHDGGQVVVEVSDDGGGIDVERVKAQAVANGLLGAELAARLSEAEACALIFAAGLSTAQRVTRVSGRGVGMDVVKENLERVGGRIELDNRFRKGLTIRVRIPLTLAVVPALICLAGGQRFAIPQSSVVELLRLTGAAAERGFETVEGAPVHRLRGSLLPIVHLECELGLEPAARETPMIDVVIVESSGRRFGLVVQRICDSEEIVVKPLTRLLEHLGVFAGATILGDGEVALIVDVAGVARRARVLGARTERGAPTPVGPAPAVRTRLLVFQVGGLRLALPLAEASRLEQFAAERVESSAGVAAVQYRDGILPLIELGEQLGHPRRDAANGKTLHVIVVQRAGRSLGLVVDRWLDVVEEELRVAPSLQREGLGGTAVIQGRVTDLLDLAAVLRRFDPSLAALAAESGAR